MHGLVVYCALFWSTCDPFWANLLLYIWDISFKEPCNTLKTRLSIYKGRIHIGLALQMNSSYGRSAQGVLGIQLYRPKGLQGWHHPLAESVICCVLPSQQIPRNVTGRREASEYLQCKKGIFFSFLSQNNRVIIREASSFCFNFLLLCLLCVYFALYTLKKSPQAFIRLSVNIL